jgi:hypothetical protein
MTKQHSRGTLALPCGRAVRAEFLLRFRFTPPPRLCCRPLARPHRDAGGFSGSLRRRDDFLSRRAWMPLLPAAFRKNP